MSGTSRPEMPEPIPFCALCGSDKVVCDAWVSWDREDQCWVLHSKFEESFCEACEQTTALEWLIPDPENAALIARQNDALRKGLNSEGAILMTAGIANHREGFDKAVKAFDAFTPDNDPHSEHDFGMLEVEGEKIFFKVDYYDAAREAHSPNKADPAVTERVLTIMLAIEY